MLDFDWYFYISTVLLQMTEEEFWRSTPRKIGALWKIHAKIHGFDISEEKQAEERLFIDQVLF